MKTIMLSETEGELKREIQPVCERAQAITIRTPDDRTAATDFLRAIKGAKDRVNTIFGPMVDAAHKAWKKATETRGSLLTPLDTAERTVKQTILAYDQEQERLRLQEQRRLQAIADEEARKERERLEKQAAKLKTPEKREERLEQAAAVVAPVVTIPDAEKPKGEATRKVWKAKLIDINALILAASQGNDVARSFLAFDQSAANRLAAATKGAVQTPGVEYYPEVSLAVRGGR